MENKKKEGGGAWGEYPESPPPPSVVVVGAAKTSRTLSWWCFNPGLAMLDLTALRVRSMILTSGTLSPVDSFAHELKV